ncbi:MAG: sugar-binding transcriptional regulator [Lachnospiraceae bacterium]|nr:sugar-binding transcriptional regulator [Lachnospiraceae bacterium]
MDIGRMYQIMRIARKYYELHMGQSEIAKEEGISKSTVSRMLQKAEELGYVKVTVEYPLESVDEIERQMKELFHLKDVFVTPNVVDNDAITLKDICRALADNLDRYIKDRTVVGVSWGKTMNCLAESIHKINAKDIRVVQLNGGVSKHTNPTGATRIVDALSGSGDGVGYMFPVPAIVDSKEISDVLKKDSQVRKVLSLAMESQVTIFSVGALSLDSILCEVGYFKEEEYQLLEKEKAVGDIASRFFNIDGQIVDEHLNERVVGLDLEDLKKKQFNIAVAAGLHKVDAILGALRGGYMNVLYTDEKTARELLKRCYME